MLPTVYGKCLINELLPIAYKDQTELHAFILVFEKNT